MTPNTNIPDSGTRAQFSTGAVRDAAPGKGLPSSIPPAAIRALAKRFEDGATKYGPRNWMQGIPLSRYIDAIFRHTLSMSEGRTDEDHDAAVLWNTAAFMWTRDAVKAGKLPEELNDLPYWEGERPVPQFQTDESRLRPLRIRRLKIEIAELRLKAGKAKGVAKAKLNLKADMKASQLDRL